LFFWQLVWFELHTLDEGGSQEVTPANHPGLKWLDLKQLAATGCRYSQRKKPIGGTRSKSSVGATTESFYLQINRRMMRGL